MDAHQPPSKILIVDDHPETLQALMSVLQEDYTIMTATNAVQAVDLAVRPVQPDLILLDVLMPDMNGYDLCQKLKGDRRTQHIPVIFVTALEQAEEEAKGFRSGGADYIVKPANPAVVKARIQNQLAIGRLMRERTQAEEALEKANTQLQAVLDAVPGMVSWISKEGKYLGCNQHLAAAYALSPSDFVNRDVGFLAETRHFSEFVSGLFQDTKATGSKEIEMDINGVPQNYLLVSQKYDDDNAAVFVGINTSEQERTKAALRDSEKRFRSLVEQMHDWVWEVDQQSRFTYISPKAQEITGYTTEALLGKQFADLMTADEAIRFATILGHMMRAHQAFTEIEVNCCHQNGKTFVLEISGSPILIDGQLTGYRGVAHDVTERKQVELDIRKALTKEKELSDLKTRFISMASHEFRTPLTTIQASAESLDRYRHKFSAEKQSAILRRIQDSVSHVTDLLSDVLTAGKAEAGKFIYSPVSLDLQLFCLDLVDELQIAQQPPITPIQFDCTATDFRGMADEKLLRHILINLLSNAVKYTPDNAAVDFTLAIANQIATFSVRDRGIGIAQDDQIHLFEAFHRGANVGNISGSGLGLMIAKQAVDAHKGTIQCTSQVGAGTTFVVALPFFPTEVSHD